MLRGEIWWASLPRPVLSEPGYRRPVLIIQSNSFNRSRINTIIIAVISSNLILEDAPGNVFINTLNSGLSKDSVINVSQILTIDKQLLDQKVKKIPGNLMTLVNDGLKLSLNL
ncbi:MAG: type II toxin-antitoxin system PemK/MazF family toxin [Lentisphaeria bacterium]|nr:type II toxin-antitoxin system PemK/MazF family toxin [Lentisphaeria bacterium]NQZ71070.1 type II toxin-antitoxin system PemK/MazF family toxin [Lentisphaeria bacterium]